MEDREEKDLRTDYFRKHLTLVRYVRSYLNLRFNVVCMREVCMNYI